MSFFPRDRFSPTSNMLAQNLASNLAVCSRFHRYSAATKAG